MIKDMIIELCLSRIDENILLLIVKRFLSSLDIMADTFSLCDNISPEGKEVFMKNCNLV